MVNLSLLRKVRSTLNLSDVKPAPFNPPIRTANRTGDIDELGQEILTEGQLEPIHVVQFTDAKGNVEYFTADGNRRGSAMRKVGFKKIEAIVWDPGQEDASQVLHALFVKLNDTKRRLANRDMVEVGLAGGPIFNTAVKSTVAYMSKLWPTGIPTIITANAGSTVLNISKRIVKYCWPAFKPDTKSFDDKVRITLLWVVRNRQQQQATAYMRLHFSPEALKKAVENDKLVPRMNA